MNHYYAFVSPRSEVSYFYGTLYQAIAHLNQLNQYEVGGYYTFFAVEQCQLPTN